MGLCLVNKAQASSTAVASTMFDISDNIVFSWMSPEVMRSDGAVPMSLECHGLMNPDVGVPHTDIQAIKLWRSIEEV